MLLNNDPSVMPTLETLCTLDTSSSTQFIDSYKLINFTLEPNISPTSNASHQKVNHSTAVQDALLDVFEKMLNPSKLSYLLFTLISSIVSVRDMSFLLTYHCPIST